jgi:hypothetical protein
MSTYSRGWNPRVPFRHSRYPQEPSLCLAACPLRLRQGQNPVRSDLDHSAVTPQSIVRAVRDETSHTNSKCKRGNGLTPLLTLRVSVPSGHSAIQYFSARRDGSPVLACRGYPAGSKPGRRSPRRHKTGRAQSRRAALFTWFVFATNSEANESSRRCVARPIRVVDVSPGELYSVENPHPHQRYER